MAGDRFGLPFLRGPEIVGDLSGGGAFFRNLSLVIENIFFPPLLVATVRKHRSGQDRSADRNRPLFL
jgi:hypothetical protein